MAKALAAFAALNPMIESSITIECCGSTPAFSAAFKNKSNIQKIDVDRIEIREDR